MKKTERPSLRVLEALVPKAKRRLPVAAEGFAERRQEMIDRATSPASIAAARLASSVSSDDKLAALEAVEDLPADERLDVLMPATARVRSLTPTPADGERVPDPHRPGMGVVEAAVADVPADQRGWRERARMGGLSDATIKALEQPGQDWSGGEAA